MIKYPANSSLNGKSLLMNGRLFQLNIVELQFHTKQGFHTFLTLNLSVHANINAFDYDLETFGTFQLTIVKIIFLLFKFQNCFLAIIFMKYLDLTFINISTRFKLYKRNFSQLVKLIFSIFFSKSNEFFTINREDTHVLYL